jgi:SET domain-containing protein
LHADVGVIVLGLDKPRRLRYDHATVASRAGATLQPQVHHKLSAAKIVLPEPGLIELVPIEGKGRGVVAKRAIKKGKLIEAGPVIKMKKKDRLDRSTVLSHYPFEWEQAPYVHAFPLGWAGLLNHSDKPNCKIEADYEGDVLCIYTLRNIEPGEELCWNYGIDPWFEVN